MPKSTTKPAKPYPSFPLYARPSGKSAKTIDRKTVYFGKLGDPDGGTSKSMRASQRNRGIIWPCPKSVTVKNFAQ